jgi:D-alanyl-D-alanine carboxypeptidase (penicillin-binding protein 5/6)
MSRRTALAFAAAVLPARNTAASAALPKTNSAAWIVADADTGGILAAHNPHKRLPPASTLKMLFADTVLPKFDKTRRHKVVDADLAGMGAGSSLVGIERGTTYTVEELWLGVFLRSGNDAVHVLCSMNGGVDKTVGEMRALAKRLQANDTHVVSPDGYDKAGQVSSAYDLTLFARAGLKNADFRQYCSTAVADFPAGGGKTFQIQNTNRLLGDYRGLIGVKNGYTTNAGNTFTGAAKRDGRTLLVTVMHPTSGYDEVYTEAAALLDWGFKAGDSVDPVGTLAEPLSATASPSPSAADGSRSSATRSLASAGQGSLMRAGTAATLSVLIAGCSLALRRRPAPQKAAVDGSKRGRRR